MKPIDQTNNTHPSKAKNRTLWVLQVLTAAGFLMAGFAKLSGQPVMVAMFDKLGLGQWFRYLTGSIELVSAILLLIPSPRASLNAVGAALLVCTMIGAVLAHLTILGGSPLPAIVLGCLSAIILWGRFSALKTLFGRPAAPAPEITQT